MHAYTIKASGVKSQELFSFQVPFLTTVSLSGLRERVGATSRLTPLPTCNQVNEDPMSNRNLRSQFIYSNAALYTKLLARVSIGSSGAPTIVSGTGMGIASVVRSSAGLYVITLQDTYNTLLGVNVISNSGASAPAAPLVNIAASAVSSLTAPHVTIQCRVPAGTATDPASGEILHIEINLNRSSLSN